MNLTFRLVDALGLSPCITEAVLTGSSWRTCRADKLRPDEVPVIRSHLPATHLQARLHLNAGAKGRWDWPAWGSRAAADLADEGGRAPESPSQLCDAARLRLEPSIELHGRTIKHCFEAQSIAHPVWRRGALAMLSKSRDADRTKEWLLEQLRLSSGQGKNRASLAEACGVSRQAVDGWVKTGRVSKSSLARAIAYFGVPGPFDVNQSAYTEDRLMRTNVASYSASVNPHGWPLTSVSYADLCALDKSELGLVDVYVRALVDRRKALVTHSAKIYVFPSKCGADPTNG